MKSELPIIIAVLAAAPVLWSAWRRPADGSWLARPAVFLAVWLGLFLLPYVFLGPNSFLWMDDEGDLLVPHLLHMARGAESGQYSHLLGAFGDLQGSFLVGGELLSPERGLMALLPLWLAIAVHKAMTCLFGFAGIYLVARRMGKASREVSLGLAALFTVSWFRMVLVTYGTGMTLATVPLGAWLLVGRLGRRHYWPGVLAYGAFIALWSNPHEGAMAVPVVVLGAMLWLRRWSLKPILALLPVFALLIANWSESVFAMLQLVGESQKAAVVPVMLTPVQRLAAEFANYGWVLLGAPLLLVEMLLALAALALWARRDLPRAVLAFLLPPVLLAAFYLFPWDLLGLGAARKATPLYMLYGFSTLAALVAAQASRLCPPLPRGPRLGLPAALLAVAAFASLGWYVGYQLINLLYRSGQAHYRIANLARPDWRDAAEPGRVVSIRGSYLQPEPSVMLAYGMAFLDTWLNLQDRRVTEYWQQGIQLTGNVDTRIGFDWGKVQDGAFRVGEVASLPLLAAANVRHIVSGVPLAGEGLRLVDGPERPPLDKPGRSGAKASDYIRDRLARAVDLGRMYVYELPGALPRVWAPERVEAMADDAPPKALLAEVARLAGQRVAVVRARDADALAGGGTVAVRRFALVPNGFAAEVDAPAGGVLAINAAASKFLSARADGTTIAIVEANGIQMAMRLPAGTRAVTVCYSRPALFPALVRIEGPCANP